MKRKGKMKKEKENEKKKEKEKKKDKENEKKNDNANENDSYKIKQLNYSLDQIIDKSKSFKEQIEQIRKVENLMSIVLWTIMVVTS